MKFQKITAKEGFNTALQYIINILIVYIIILLVIGLGKTLLSMRALFNDSPIGDAFTGVVTDILTFLVIMELFRSFIEYFKAHRFRLHNMIDPAIILVIRELIVNLYKNGHMDLSELAGFSLLILSLGAVRALAVHFSPAKNSLEEKPPVRNARAA